MNKLFLTCSGFVVNYIVHSVCQERITQLLFEFQLVQGWRLKWESFSSTYPVNYKRQWLNEQRWLVEPLQCMIFTWWRVVLCFEWAAKQIVVHYPLWSKGSLDWMTWSRRWLLQKLISGSLSIVGVSWSSCSLHYFSQVSMYVVRNYRCSDKVRQILWRWYSC